MGAIDKGHYKKYEKYIGLAGIDRKVQKFRRQDFRNG